MASDLDLAMTSDLGLDVTGDLSVVRTVISHTDGRLRPNVET